MAVLWIAVGILLGLLAASAALMWYLTKDGELW